MSYGLAQARYAADAAETVSPARLLTMLYDRLVSDLATAELAMTGGDIATTGHRLGRAQEILLELHATLDLEIWPQGEPLARLYLWLVNELMQARLRNDPQRVADCRELIEPLRDAWHSAAGMTAGGGVTPSPEGHVDGAA
ncbi:MAG: flagellar export chaperone FliS [Kineosporiaceae bacterium]